MKKSELKQITDEGESNPYSLYKKHPQFKEAEQAISKILKTTIKWKDVQSVLDNYREAGADDTASREAIYKIFLKSKSHK